MAMSGESPATSRESLVVRDSREWRKPGRWEMDASGVSPDVRESPVSRKEYPVA